jgi:hypothetical protein
MAVSIDLSGRAPAAGEKDVLFCRASLRDAGGTVVGDAWENVAFGATGGVALVGANPFSSDVGIASILLQAEPGAPAGAVYALAVVRGARGVRVLGASAALAGEPPAFELRYTADGSAPGAESRLYAAVPVEAGHVRAALLVRGRVVATLDEAAEKFRVRGSAAPDAREPFRRG